MHFSLTLHLYTVLTLHKRYFIIDQQIARHFVQYTELKTKFLVSIFIDKYI